MSPRNLVHRARLFLRVLILSLLALGAAPPAFAFAEGSRWHGATGGIVRFPNDAQPQEAGNLFAEAWVKLGYRIYKTDKLDLSLFALGNHVMDSAGQPWNNSNKLGLGLSLSWQVSDALNVTFSARHDWYRERGTGEKRNGPRYAIDFYYYRYWAAAPDKFMFGLSQSGTVFKSYGTLAYPGSLVEKDRNLVLTLGAELSRDLVIPDSKWIVSPFVDIDFSWDSDRNEYNNKLIPGVGVKLRYPLKHGEIFAGARLAADYRPVSGTTSVKPGLFLGWYKGF
ncbi:hypothetical protein BMG00_17240 [Thioclava marina]|uniref:Uncharacterized protein n=1 Tax=Thioclava marina TaxID=1915077 RepID=A0ABX3MH34_9RHOB|nr:hypothetical protein [Thioclava marina]OOY10900.1 hypothetical protein BMG00_17240 [Thioclava marina]